MSNDEKITKRWSVWVGGVEVNDYYLTYEKAKNLANEYLINGGYDDVILMSTDGGYDNESI